MAQPLPQGASRIRICLLGSSGVGKTHLAYRLTDSAFNEATSRRQTIFTKYLPLKNQQITYIKSPAITPETADHMAEGAPFDMLLFIFKDSTSFAQLYEFLEAITAKAQGEDRFGDYWGGVQNIVVVYSDYLEQEQVQIEQLFGILCEEIRNFNRISTIKQFVLKKDMVNSHYLMELIEKVKFEQKEQSTLHPKQQEGGQNLRQEMEQKRQENIEILVDQAKIESPSQVEDIPQLKEIALTSTEQQHIERQLSTQQVEQIIDQQAEHTREQHGELHNKEQKQNEINVGEKGQIQFQVDPISQVEREPIQSGREVKKTEHSNEKIFEQTLQRPTELTQIELKAESTEISPISPPTTNSLKGEAKQQTHLHEKQTTQQRQDEHYRQVYDRLLQKMNNEEIEQSKKTSYKNLFEEFRKTSKEDSKISKELLQYWHLKIERLEEEHEPQDEEQHEPQDEEEQIPDKPEEEELRTQRNDNNHSQLDVHAQKHHGQLLKPQSNYASDGRPRKQKVAQESELCKCEVM